MRFLIRCALISILFLLTLIVLLLQYRSISKIDRSGNGKGKGSAEEQYSIEDSEIQRLLLEGAGGVAEEPQQQVVPSALPDSPGLLLFPIGRIPASARGAGPAGELTLNVVVVLVVSLLSIAILITAICCVVIIALALDSSATRFSSSSSSSSADFLLSAWPDLATQYHRLHQSPVPGPTVFRTPGLAKLFRDHQQQYNMNMPTTDTPPLTDDEEEEEGEEEEEDQHEFADSWSAEAARSWPNAVWHQLSARDHPRPRRNSFTV